MTEALDQHVELGKTGIVVSRIDIGTMTWGKKVRMTAYGGTDRPEDEEDAFRTSLEPGVTLFDAAEMCAEVFLAGRTATSVEAVAKQIEAAFRRILGCALCDRGRSPCHYAPS